MTMATRLFSLGLIGSLLVSTTAVGAQTASSDWSPVMAVASKAEVVVTVRGSKAIRATFVQANDSVLIVRTGRWQTVQTIPRDDVMEIRTGRSAKRRALGLLGGFGGAIAGAFVGGIVATGGNKGEDLGGLAAGMGVGLVGGAILGYHAVTHTNGALIYRAPQPDTP